MNRDALILRRLRRAMWVVEHVPCGVLNPWVFGLFLHRWPHKVAEGGRRIGV